MLAGRMKLNTFLLVVGAIGGAVAAGGGVWLAMREPAAAPPAPVEAPVAAAAPTPPVATAPASPDAITTRTGSGPDAVTTRPADGAAPAPTAAAAPASAREVDAVVLGYAGKDIGTDKLKDVTKGKPFKVNVYQDAGKPTANRAKIDLDRDDKWDEKITFDGGEVKREVAPADDEVYTVKSRWDGQGWVEGG